LTGLNLLFQQTGSAGRALSSYQDGDQEGHSKKGHPEVNRSLGEDGRGLRSEDVFRHCGTEGRAQAFTARTLHENDEHQQKAIDDQNGKQNRDSYRKPHKGRNMCWRARLVKRLLASSGAGSRACSIQQSLFENRERGVTNISRQMLTSDYCVLDAAC
jgi:hypothetical protein